MTAKIIEVTPETEQRYLARRVDDMALIKKAERYDRLMVDIPWQFEFWAKAWHTRKAAHATFGERPGNAAGYYEGQTHAYAHILKQLGRDALCPCDPCTRDRMSDKEAIAEALSQGLV